MSTTRFRTKANSVVEITTDAKRWVVPHNCEYLKLLIRQENLAAADLRFANRNDCKGFVRQLFLLALEDEFEVLNVACFGYLQQSDATPEMKGQYWMALFVLAFFFRIISSILLRIQSLKYK